MEVGPGRGPSDANVPPPPSGAAAAGGFNEDNHICGKLNTGANNPPQVVPQGWHGIAWGQQECSAYVGPVHLYVGMVMKSPTPTIVVPPFPGFGPEVIAGVSFNAVQQCSPPVDSDGPQGWNWFQDSRPQLVWGGSSGTAPDVIHLIRSATSYQSFQLNPSSSEYFGINGATGAMKLVAKAGAEEIGTVEYRDRNDRVMTFFAFDADSGYEAIEGQLWKIEDADAGGSSTAAYVSDAKGTITLASAIAGFEQASMEPTSRVSTVFDSAGRRFTYGYATVGVSRLTSIAIHLETAPSTWTLVAQTDYGYYTSDELAGSGLPDRGRIGDLKTVTTTMPATSGGNVVKKAYYRYYCTVGNGTVWDDAHALKLAMDAEGVRRYELANGANSYDTATDADLKPYAASYFEYDSDGRVTTLITNGECGCGGSNPNGAYTFAYAANSTSPNTTSGYDCFGAWDDSTWDRRTVVTLPDSSRRTIYFDEYGQILGEVVTAGDPASATEWWITKTERDSDSRPVMTLSPETVTGYTHATGEITVSNSVGLVRHTAYYAPTFPVIINYMRGLVPVKIEHSEGRTGTRYLDREWTYLDTGDNWFKAVGTVTIGKPIVLTSFEYHTEVTSGASTDRNATTYAYTFWDSTSWLVKQVVISEPVVSEGTNGSDAATTTERYLYENGLTGFTKDQGGHFTYFEYDTLTGQLTRRVEDVDDDDTAAATAATALGATLPTSDGLALETSYTYDLQGRLMSSTMPHGRITARHYTKLADNREVQLSFPLYAVVSTVPTWYGPVSYRVLNHAGQAESTMTLTLDGAGNTSTDPAAIIDEAESDAMTAVDTDEALWAHLSTASYDEAGSRMLRSRTYYVLPAPTSPPDPPVTIPTAGYDETLFGYDNRGRQTRIEDPDGTIHRTDFDVLNRTTARWVGTNDSGSPNMTEFERREYDGGGEGNGHLTKITLDPNGVWTGSPPPPTTADQRVTDFAYTYRGFNTLVMPPAAPYTVTAYDNLGRPTASAGYSSASGLTAGSAPSSATNRVSLDETFYDARGQVWKTITHKIDHFDGGNDGSDDDSLTTLHWFDAERRPIKSVGPGGLNKMQYDAVGRVIRTYELAKINDSDYSDADDVSGDLVLEERQTYLDVQSGLPLMSVTVERWHDDGSGGTIGQLDTDDDLSLVDISEVDGRPSIVTMFYDSFDRPIATAVRGTNGTGAGSDYDRDTDGTTVPTRSDTILVTSTVYNDDGTPHDVTDPMERVNRTVFDAARRPVATIANYTGGSTVTADRDNDVYTRMEYTDGHQTKLWVDIDGSGGTPDSGVDQVTVYTFGVPKGTGAGDSEVAHGGLLWKVAYPDSSSGTDVVSYAYNALMEPIWTKDQHGTVMLTAYDALGREVARTVDDLGTGIDGAVRRVETAFDARGQVTTVTQYDAETSGTVLDQVKHSFDDWGNVKKIEQDHDSAVGTGTPFEVSWSYAKVTPSGGRPRVERSTQTLPGTGVVTFGTGTTTEPDHLFGRVNAVSAATNGGGSVSIGSYTYLGTGNVVGITYPQTAPDVVMARYGSGTPRNYEHLDRFGRVGRDLWAASTTEIHDVAISYDRNSGITKQDDDLTFPDAAAVYPPGRDAEYVNDGLDRLTKAVNGKLTTGTMGSIIRDERWQTTGGALGLSQTGNWTKRLIDLDGDANFNEAGEMNESNTFNLVNEWEERDTNSDTTPEFTLDYDDAGNMIDDGERYTFVYDAFGRMVTVKNRLTPFATVAAYRYNGMNQRITQATGGTTERFVYDDRWRMVAVYRGSETSPRERFIHHAAGMDGRGYSSYIDDLICRDQDVNLTGGGGGLDGTLEQRRYVVQNWRHDVAAVVNLAGRPMEWNRYTAYGEVASYPYVDADYDGDGDVDSDDSVAFFDDWDNSEAKADVNRDGSVDSNDTIDYFESWDNGLTRSDGVGAASGLRFGYAGYVFDFGTGQYHVRHRVYEPRLGRWTRRDPLGYVDGMGLYGYVRNNPVTRWDIWGFAGTCPTEPDSSTWEDAQFYFCKEKAALELALWADVFSVAGCSLPVIRCRLCSGSDDPQPGMGVTRCGQNGSPATITVCVDSQGAPDYGATLGHEMQHALDCCVDSRYGSDDRTCWDQFCSEVRAYRAECRKAHPEGGTPYNDCLLAGALASVRSADMNCYKNITNPKYTDSVLDFVTACGDSSFLDPFPRIILPSE